MYSGPRIEEFRQFTLNKTFDIIKGSLSKLKEDQPFKSDLFAYFMS